jgi:hypothetical protein
VACRYFDWFVSRFWVYNIWTKIMNLNFQFGMSGFNIRSAFFLYSRGLIIDERKLMLWWFIIHNIEYGLGIFPFCIGFYLDH